MKTFAAVSTVFLFLLLTVSVSPVNGQEREEERNGAKSAQQQEDRKAQEEKSKDQSDQEPRTTKPDHEKSDQERQRTDQEPTKQETAHPQHEQREPAQTQREQRHPVQAQRGKRIPDNKFRASFGQRHTFRVQRSQVINVAQPVIVYGGYSFELVEVWPADWAFDDPCYIDFVDDEYFLFDTFHPGFRIALIVIE